MKNIYSINIDDASESEAKVCIEMVKKEVMAALLLHGADKSQQGSPKSTLTQHMSMGKNQYLR